VPAPRSGLVRSDRRPRAFQRCTDVAGLLGIVGFELQDRDGNSDYTIVGRFEELRGAIQLIRSGGALGFITRPFAALIPQILQMRRQPLFIPDSRQNGFWAVYLLKRAVDLKAPCADASC
jgi:hypothetical protein